MENSKKCACCDQVKDKTNFTKYKNNKDGLFSYCKSCKSAKAKEDRERNKKRITDYMKDYNKNMPLQVKENKKKRAKEYYKENREDQLAKRKERYRNNKDQENNKSKEWYKANKDNLKETRKLWERNNKALRSEITTRRRLRIKENGIYKVTEKEITKLLNQPCYLCKIKPSQHLDHIVPISKGGTHSIGNLLGTCQECNLKKGSKLLIQYKNKGEGYLLR